MKITPEQLERYSRAIAKIYNSLEGEIIRIIIRQLRFTPNRLEEWQMEKLSDLHLFNKKVVKELSKATRVAESEIERMFEETGIDMVKDIDEALPYASKPLATNLDTVMRGYFNQSWSQIENIVNQTLITTQYGVGTAELAYQDILNKTASFVTSGLYTYEEGVERAVRELAERGIQTRLTDKGGNTWSLERYTRTVIKSTLTNSYDEVRKERMAEYGEHLVVVTSHAGARDACFKIQAEVVDLRYPEQIPENSPYKSIYDEYWEAHYKEPGGHRGINCRHFHIPFVHGVNTNNQPKFPDKVNERVNKARTRLRQLENEVVNYKKDLMVAENFGHQESIDRYAKLVEGREQAIEEHLKQNPDYISRSIERETVYTPLEAFLGDFSYDYAD